MMDLLITDGAGAIALGQFHAKYEQIGVSKRRMHPQPRAGSECQSLFSQFLKVVRLQFPVRDVIEQGLPSGAICNGFILEYGDSTIV
jgi:hypothetical protein